MDTKKNSGPIPNKSVECIGDPVGEKLVSQMTIRHHFAGLAMQGILSGNTSDTWQLVTGKQTGAEWVALNAIDVADALLAELEKKDE